MGVVLMISHLRAAVSNSEVVKYVSWQSVNEITKCFMDLKLGGFKV